MTRLIASPWDGPFEELIDAASFSLMLATPFLSASACQRLIRRIEERGRAQYLDLSLLTNLSLENMVSGVTDVAAIVQISNAIPSTRVRFLPGLHAKVYIADARAALVTSANLTQNGISRNFEYGVWVDDPPTVAQAVTDLTRYSSLGSPVSLTQLELFSSITAELRQVADAAQRTIKRKVRDDFESKLSEATTEVLRARAAGRTVHAIFADAIIYLLQRGSMGTDTINNEIKGIHPDLCDDSVDRVIDGQHFGKRWKHAVRTAQVYLRRGGRIRRVEDRWQLV